MALTLSLARKYYASRAGAGNSFIDRLNEVQARLFPKVAPKQSKAPLRFAVYVDSRGNHIITMPEWVETVVGGAYEARCSSTVIDNNFHTWGGRTLPVQNGWYEFSPSGPGLMIGTYPSAGIIRMEGKYTTFADWNTSMKLRVKLENDESPGGKIIFRGVKDGERIWSTDPDTGTNIEGVALPFTNATVTTTHTFDEPPYQVIKPVTRGRLRIYTVDSDDVETLVADYNPQEQEPAYARYKVPADSTTT